MSGRSIAKASDDGAVLRQEVKRRRFTRQENDMIAALYAQGVKPSQIAARLGIKRETIETKLKAWGVERTLRAPSASAAYRNVDQSLPRECQFAEMLSLGFTVSQIGEVMGYKDYDSANAAFQRLRRHVGPQAR